MVDRIKGVRHPEASEDEDRDGPLLLWISAKVVFIAAVLWFSTPHPMPCTVAGSSLSWCHRD